MIKHHIGQPACHRTSLLERLIHPAQLAICIEVEVGVIVLAQYINQCRLAMNGFHLIKRSINVSDRYGIEILRKVGFPTEDFPGLGLRYAPARLLDYLTATDTCLIALARGMNHLRNDVKQEVVRYREYDAVYRFVHIHGTELAVILRNLCRMRWSNLILALLHCLVHGCTGSFSA